MHFFNREEIGGAVCVWEGGGGQEEKSDIGPGEKIIWQEFDFVCDRYSNFIFRRFNSDDFFSPEAGFGIRPK